MSHGSQTKFTNEREPPDLPLESISYFISPARTGGQQPGFFMKRRAVIHRLSKKPGFFDRAASRTVHISYRPIILCLKVVCFQAYPFIVNSLLFIGNYQY